MTVQINKSSLVVGEKADEGLLIFKSSLVVGEKADQSLMMFKSSLVVGEIEMTDTPRRQPMISTF
ncbi:hypothetical protein [Croceicoccus sp. BE223]|uniref:hypothetical protein n=1 Tax=Croceicoccus sp. BE223 TaxID=2817716 RepID=UPI00285AF34D|nr:hypothetical protein [Croceicoccus sp. BE223]MDR7101463.1 hypothetical protein [Croceicoccus sp. BE223]